MTNNRELILVHANMHKMTLKKPINVMLTPQFYTVKKEALPIQYAYQAKKIAPSLFDGLLEDDSVHEYMVFKEKGEDEDYWVFIAYASEKIVSFLEEKGIESRYVHKIYFAQQAVHDFEQAPLALGENEVLLVKDGTVVVAPRVVLGTETNLQEFKQTFTPKTSGISIKNSSSNASSFITQTQALSLAAIFMLFAGIFIIEGLRYKSDSNSNTEEMNTLYEAHPGLQASYQREAILNKYSTIDQLERKKRDSINTASKMIFKGVTLTQIYVDKQKFYAQFSCSTVTISKRVKTLLEKRDKNHFFTIKGEKNLTLEGAL